LKVLGDPLLFVIVKTRTGTTISELRDTLNTYMAQATSTEEKYAHIDEKDKQSIVESARLFRNVWMINRTPV